MIITCEDRYEVNLLILLILSFIFIMINNYYNFYFIISPYLCIANFFSVFFQSVLSALRVVDSLKCIKCEINTSIQNIQVETVCGPCDIK